MLSTPSPVVGNQKLRQNTSRKPLQPKNFQAIPIDHRVRAKPKQEWISISMVVDDSNKENHPIYTTPTATATKTKTKMESLDASLAEELSAIRKKLERLRLEKEKTEKMLRERDLEMEMQMQELEKRGEAQKKLEMVVDKLYRLKELKSSCLRISPIRSLREKERKGKNKEAAQSPEGEGESMDQSIVQSSPSVEEGVPFS